MRPRVRRRLDDALDRRVDRAAWALAGERARRDAAAAEARRAGARVAVEADRRVAGLRRPPVGPLCDRGAAGALGRARVLALAGAAAAARGAARDAGGRCASARRGLLRALVRRRALRRVLDGR